MQKAIMLKRKEKDILRLKTKFEVYEPSNSDQIVVTILGPENSLYFIAKWKIGLVFPDLYPYKSPSICFLTRIFHPNIDEKTGAICLDVINQKWSPMFDLLNIFEIFLPQLLLYPNPHDPLNSEAATLMLKNLDKYQLKVKESIFKYASDNHSQQFRPQNGVLNEDLVEEISQQSSLTDTSELLSDF